MTAKRYDVIDKEEPRGQSVTYDGIPCTARHCCTNLNRLTEENEQLKAQLKDCEKRVTDKEVEWLRNNTVWEQMPSNKRTFITTSTKEDYK